MRSGRPRIPIGSHGTITTRREGSRTVAETRVRDLDGRVRQVRVFASTATAARISFKERMRDRPVMPGSGVLQPTSAFADLLATRIGPWGPLWPSVFDADVERVGSGLLAPPLP